MNNKYVYPEGYYKVRVIGQALTPSKTTGELYLLLTVEVLEKTDKKNGSTEGIEYGKHRYIRLFFGDGAGGTTLDILAAAGFDIKGDKTLDVAQLQESHEDYFSLNGFEFSAKCSHREYLGETQDDFRPAFKWQLQAPNSWMTNKLQPANQEQIDSLNAMLGAAQRPYSRAGAR